MLRYEKKELFCFANLNNNAFFFKFFYDMETKNQAPFF